MVFPKVSKKVCKRGVFNKTGNSIFTKKTVLSTNIQAIIPVTVQLHLKRIVKYLEYEIHKHVYLFQFAIQRFGIPNI